MVFYFDETSFRGGFYYNILRHTPEQKYDTTAYIRKGGSDGDVYAVEFLLQRFLQFLVGIFFLVQCDTDIA